MRRRWLSVLTVCLPALATAQSAPGAFETVGLGLEVVGVASGGALDRHWEPGTGIEAGVTFPFYAGAVGVGLQHAHHDARRGEVPGFRGRLIFAEWGGGARLADRVSLGGAVRVGVYEMRFDGDTIPAFRRNESELVAALRPTVEYAIGRAWCARAAAAYQVVFTDPRIEQVLLSIGVARRFRTPAWLRDFLD